MIQMRHGFLKYYILKLLSEGERSGYGLIKAIEAETGCWKPSTGSMYPLLQTLEDQGLLTHEGEDDRKVYRLTKRGRQVLSETHQAKAEILESLQRACEVFGRIFADQEEVEGLVKQLRNWFTKAPLLGLEKVPKSLWPRISLVRQMIMNLPYERLSEKDIEQLNEIIEGAIVRLGEFMDARP
jgi:DNA-binding PadR family transcriptional regulator